jgi:hypothetical protein
MMTRWKAFSIHIAISATIAIGISALMLMLWYTPSFFSAAGGQKLLIVLLGVDVTLGPLITLIIFNSKKSRKQLAFDFSVIGILQFAALFYGMNVMFESRPVYVAFNKDAFYLATADQIFDEDLAQSSYSEFKSLPLTGPLYVYAEMPTSKKEIDKIEFMTPFGKGLHCFPQYFKPYSENMQLAGQAAKPLAELKKLNESRIAEIDQAIKNTGRAESDLGFLPLHGVNVNFAVLLVKSDGKVLEILQMNPM